MKSRTWLSISRVLTLTTVIYVAAQEQQNESTTTVTANPIPLINQPLMPGAIRPAGAGFALTINGTGFAAGSVVMWNGSARTTTHVSRSQLKASISATDVAKASTARVTVMNPTPGGGTSNTVLFEITRPTSAVTMMTSNVHVGTSPNGVAVGDFNGDGKLDLAVANPGSNTVSILLGKGDGTFQAPMNFGAPAPQSIAVGDFNKDGKPDLAVANMGTNSVSIFLGNGNGTFRAQATYVTGDSPNSIAVGDFNDDGHLDMAVVNGGNNTGVSSVSILLGNGDGTFHDAVKYAASFGQSVAVGDFNRDGKLDLAVVNFGSSNVGVLLGNGDGTFHGAVDYAADNASTGLAVGDFNGDGKLDLAVANIVSNAGFGDIGVLLGNGDGTFQPAVKYGVGSNPSTVVAGDFNGDGRLDLAVVNFGGYGNAPSVSLLLGKGNGTFQPAVEHFDVGSNPVSLAVGDFNNDGRLDMIVGDSAGSAIDTLIQPHLVTGFNPVLEPTSLNFSSTQVVGTSSVQPVLLTNYGGATLSIASIVSTGDFHQADTCGSSLMPGSGCTISVTFKPTEGGIRTGTLEIFDDAPGSPQTVSLIGTGTVAELSPTSLTFGCVTICLPILGCHCDCSGPKGTTLTNVGVNSLDIAEIATSGPFSQSNSCSTSLAGGKSCAITVTWLRSTGEGELSVSDNGGGSPQTVTLSGIKRCTPP